MTSEAVYLTIESVCLTIESVSLVCAAVIPDSVPSSRPVKQSADGSHYVKSWSGDRDRVRMPNTAE